MKGKYIILTMVALLLSLFADGQEISVVADYPEVVQAGEQFNVSWTINSGGGEFSEPSFAGFYKLMGPQTSYSSKYTDHKREDYQEKLHILMSITFRL